MNRYPTTYLPIEKGRYSSLGAKLFLSEKKKQAYLDLLTSRLARIF
jgi:hypothetical protein